MSRTATRERWNHHLTCVVFRCVPITSSNYHITFGVLIRVPIMSWNHHLTCGVLRFVPVTSGTHKPTEHNFPSSHPMALSYQVTKRVIGAVYSRWGCPYVINSQWGCNYVIRCHDYTPNANRRLDQLFPLLLHTPRENLLMATLVKHP